MNDAEIRDVASKLDTQGWDGVWLAALDGVGYIRSDTTFTAEDCRALRSYADERAQHLCEYEVKVLRNAPTLIAGAAINAARESLEARGLLSCGVSTPLGEAAAAAWELGAARAFCDAVVARSSKVGGT